MSQFMRKVLLKMLGHNNNRSKQILKKKKEDFWALKDLNFDVYEGERIGIIGRNGAGKSTLLKILSRLLYPTRGKALIRGRVTSLIEVGIGFNQALTGMENIYLNGRLHGLTKSEIQEKFDEIVEFSELGRFIDEPIKHYSSGMKSRLGFSVAAHLEPDILMLDEVLSVGDIGFSRKCLSKVEGMTGGGQTLLFVSHSPGDVLKFCDRAIWLENGQIKFDGSAIDAIEMYQEAMSPQKNEVILEHRTERAGSGMAIVRKISIFDRYMNPVEAAVAGEDLIITLDYWCDINRLKLKQKKMEICLYIESDRGQKLMAMPNYVYPESQNLQPHHEGQLRCKIKRLPLIPGRYNISFTLSIELEKADKLLQSRGLIVLNGDFYGSGHLPPDSGAQFCCDFAWENVKIES